MSATGAYGGEKTDADVLALFATPEVLTAVNTHLSSSYSAVIATSFKSQVVAGVNYRVKATADGSPITITAFKGLPHTGGALEIKSVVASHDAF